MLRRARRGRTGCRGAAGCAEATGAGVRERPRRWDRAARPGLAPGSRCEEAKGAGGARAPSFSRFFPGPHPAASAGPRTRALSVSAPARSGQVGGLGGKQGSDARGSPGCARRAWAGRSLGGTGSVRVGGPDAPCLPSGSAGAGEEKGNKKRGGSEYGPGDPERPSSLQRLRFPMDQLWASAGHDEETETRRR